MAVPLTAKAGLDTTGFGAGVQEIRNKLTQLNTSLAENRQELKDATKEANNLRKAQQDLAAAMKNGGTEEQKREMQELSDKLAQVNSRIGTLKTTEAELRSAVRSANKELDEQYDATKRTATATAQASTAMDSYAKETKQASSALDSYAKETKQASTAMDSFATTVKAVIASAAAKTLTEWLFGSNAEMEQYITSFGVMLGDAAKAEELMSKLADFAAVTPFELTDVIGNAQMLMNYGIAADEVVEKMTQLGNLAGGNAQKLDRVTIAYGQMLAKGKVTNEEMRQMLEAGVPILQSIADTMGITTAEVQDLASKSKIGIDELNNAIASLTSNGGQFAGMMEKQSETMLGMASTAKDIIAQIGRDVGEEAFDKLKDEFSDLLDKIQELEADGTLARWAEEAGSVLADLVEGFIDLTGFIIDNKEAVIALVAAYATMKGVKSVISDFDGMAKGIDAASKSIMLLKTDLTEIPGAASKATSALTGAGASLSTLASTAGIAAAAIATIGATVSYVSSLFTLDKEVEALVGRSDELRNSVNETISSFEAEAAIIKTQAEAYEELRNKTERNAEEEKKLKTLADELSSSLGGNVEVVNSLTGEYNDLTDAVNNYIAKQEERVRAEAMEDALKEAYKQLADIDRQIEEESQRHADAQTEIWTAWHAGLTATFASQGETYQFLNNQKALREERSDVEELIDYYLSLIGDSYEESATLAEENSARNVKSFEEIEKAAEECRKSTNELANSAKTLSNAFAEQEENGSLSTDTILSLVDAGYAAALAVDAETGAAKLNAEAYRELAKAKLEAQKVDLMASKSEIEADFLVRMNQAAGSGDYKAIERIRQEKEKATAEIDAQLMALGAIDFDKIISGSYGKKTSTGTKTSNKLPEEYTQGKKDLKYKLDMGEIDEDGYYASWYELMRKHGISKNSDEWRSVDVAKKKYEDKLEEDNKKTSAAAIKSRYADINKAFKEASDERIKQIDKELAAKKKAADEAIEAIDAEIQARKRAKEDDELQDEINAINAQLKYAQLDDFSRAQLERQLQQLYDQQANVEWERSAEDRKDAIRSEISSDEESAAAQKQAINEAADTVESALSRTAEGIALTASQIEAAAYALQEIFSSLSTGSVGGSQNITNNITTNGGKTTNNNTFTIGTENYTIEQLSRVVFEILGNPKM